MSPHTSQIFLKKSTTWPLNSKRSKYIDPEELMDIYQIKKEYLKIRTEFESNNTGHVQTLDDKRIQALYHYIREQDDSKELVVEEGVAEYKLLLGFRECLVRVKHFPHNMPQHSSREIGKGGFGKIIEIKEEAKKNGQQQIPKCLKLIKFKKKHKIYQIKEIVNQFAMLMVGWDLQVGPKVFQDEDNCHIKVFQDYACFTMERGLPLKQCIFDLLEKGTEERELLKTTSKRLYRDIGFCLFTMHRLKMVHRDIKHENIIYSHTLRRFVLCDFGLALMLSYKPTDSYCVQGYQGTREFSYSEYEYTTQFKFVNLYLNDFYGLYLVAEPKEIERRLEEERNGKMQPVIKKLGLVHYLSDVKKQFSVIEKNKINEKDRSQQNSECQHKDQHPQEDKENQLRSKQEWILQLKLRTFGYSQEIFNSWSKTSSNGSEKSRLPNREEYQREYLKNLYKQQKSRQVESYVSQKFDLQQYQQTAEQLLSFNEDKSLIRNLENIITTYKKSTSFPKKFILKNYFLINKIQEHQHERKKQFTRKNKSLNFQMLNQFVALLILIFIALKQSLKKQIQSLSTTSLDKNNSEILQNSTVFDCNLQIVYESKSVSSLQSKIIYLSLYKSTKMQTNNINKIIKAVFTISQTSMLLNSFLQNRLLNNKQTNQCIIYSKNLINFLQHIQLKKLQIDYYMIIQRSVSKDTVSEVIRFQRFSQQKKGKKKTQKNLGCVNRGEKLLLLFTPNLRLCVAVLTFVGEGFIGGSTELHTAQRGQSYSGIPLSIQRSIPKALLTVFRIIIFLRSIVPQQRNYYFEIIQKANQFLDKSNFQKIKNHAWQRACQKMNLGKKDEVEEIVKTQLNKQYSYIWFLLLDNLEKRQSKQNHYQKTTQQKASQELSQYQELLISYEPAFKIIEGKSKNQLEKVERCSFLKVEWDRFKALEKKKKRDQDWFLKVNNCVISKQSDMAHNCLLSWKMLITLELHNKASENKQFVANILCDKVYHEIPFFIGALFLDQTFGFYYNCLFFSHTYRYLDCSRNENHYFGVFFYCMFKLCLDRQDYEAGEFLKDLKAITQLIQSKIQNISVNHKSIEEKPYIFILCLIKMMESYTQLVFYEEQIKIQSLIETQLFLKNDRRARQYFLKTGNYLFSFVCSNRKEVNDVNLFNEPFKDFLNPWMILVTHQDNLQNSTIKIINQKKYFQKRNKQTNTNLGLTSQNQKNDKDKQFFKNIYNFTLSLYQFQIYCYITKNSKIGIFFVIIY